MATREDTGFKDDGGQRVYHLRRLRIVNEKPSVPYIGVKHG